MNERTDERIKSNSNSKWTNRNEQMANSFDVKFNRKKPIFCPTFSFFVGPLFFHALELSYVNEKVIMNLKRKKKEKIILPVAHVRCQFTFKLLCMGSLICPSLFYARLSQSELCWSANNMSETTGTPLSFAAFYLNCKSNIHRTIFFYHFHNTHDFIGFFFIS